MRISLFRTAAVSVLLTAWSAVSGFSQSYTIKTIAGGALPDGIPGTSASIDTQRAAVDAAGNAFIIDQFRNAVFRLDAASGALTVFAGNGTAGFSGDGGPAIQAQLNYPTGVAVDADGNLYIADAGNNRIRKVSAGLISTVAGNGTAGFAGDDGPATSGQLNYPFDVAVDGTANLYIADRFRVRKVANGIITTIAGNGNSSYAGENGPAISASFTVAGIAVDTSGNLYIADSGNSRVYKIENGVLTTVAGNGSPGYSGDRGPATAAALNRPSSVAVDASGVLYIADTANHRVRQVVNGVITTLAGNGREGFRGDNGPAAAAELDSPGDVSVDASGIVYITDTNNACVRRVLDGTITTVAGGGDPLGETGPATGAGLGDLKGLAIDADGSLYISDAGYSLIRKVTNGNIATVAGSCGCGFRGDNGPATSAWLQNPAGVAVDSANNLYIADTDNNRIRKVSNGVITTIAGNGKSGYSGEGPATGESLSGPSGVAIDAAGNVFIADTFNNLIREVSNGQIYLFPTFDNDNNQPNTSSRLLPSAISIDGAGNLYVADWLNGRIKKITPGKIMTTLAGGGTDNSGSQGPATSAGLALPNGVAVDTFGNVYIAETNNNRIRRISNGVITTIAGTGGTGFSGDDGPALSALLDGPWGIAVDASFNIYFSDTGNLRVRRLVPSGPPCTAASVSPASLSAPIAGGSLSVTIAKTSCAWAIQGLPSWVTYSGDAVQTGTGTITLTVAPNSGPARQAYLPIAGALVLLMQSGPAAAIAPQGVVALDSNVSSIQPGSWISIFGSNLATGTYTWNGDFPAYLGGVGVLINGKYGYLSYVSPTQINLQAPDDTTTGPVTVTVYSPFGTVTATVTLAAYAPSLSRFDNRYVAAVIPTGDGSGAYGNGSYDLAGPPGHFSFNTRPVRAGEIVELYGVGFGPTDPPVPSGKVFTGVAPTQSPVTVTIGGVPAIVRFSGLTSAGVYQLNVTVPNVGSGDQLVRSEVNGTASSDGIYLNVK